MKKYTMFIGSALALVALSTVAHARDFGAVFGTTNNANRACFDLSYSAIQQNSCSGSVPWNLGLVIDSTAANYSPFYSVYTPNGGIVKCATVGMSEDHRTWNATPVVNNPTSGYSVISPGSVYVAYAGDLYVTCYMAQGTTFFNAHW